MSGMVINGSLKPLADKLKGVDKRLHNVTKLAAFRLERTIVKHIQNQDLDWEPLEAKYLLRKIAEGFSEDIRIRTGTSIETVRVIDLGRDQYFVGWARGVRSKEGEDLVQINAVHEYGSNDGTIPARPVVLPSVNELREWFEAELRKELRVALVA
jgi:hypothetical protein